MKKLIVTLCVIALVSCQKEIQWDIQNVWVEFDTTVKTMTLDTMIFRRLFDAKCTVHGGSVYLQKFGWRLTSENNKRIRLRDMEIKRDGLLFLYVSTTNTWNTFEQSVIISPYIDSWWREGDPPRVFPIKWEQGEHSLTLYGKPKSMSGKHFDIEFRLEDLIMVDSTGTPVQIKMNHDNKVIKHFRIR